MLIYLILITILAAKLIGGIIVVKFRDKSHIMLGFSAGAMLAVALFDLLPEAIELTAKTFDINLVMTFVIFGFCAYMIIDRLFSLHSHDNCDKLNHTSVFNILAIVLHSVLDGLSIGLAFNLSYLLGVSVAVAVLAHSISDGVNAASVVLKDGKRKVFGWSIVNALSPVLGFIASFFMKINLSSFGLVMALIVGLFLYISTNDLLPEAHHKHSSVWTTAATIFGALLIVSITCLFN